MGYLGCLFAWMHPIRHTGRRVRRALTPRPIRRLLRTKNQVLHPVSSAERAVFRAVDRAVTPKRKRKRRQPRMSPAPDSGLRQIEPARSNATLEPAHRSRSELLQGFAAFSDKDLELVERNFRSIIAAAPDLGIAHNDLGFVLLAKGEAGDALAAFKRAEELGSDRPELVEANMACCHYLLGDAAASSALFENCLSSRAFTRSGILYGIAGDRLFLVSVPSAAAYAQLMALNAAWSALRADQLELAATRAARTTDLLGGAPDQSVTNSLKELRAELGRGSATSS
jgi:tetratricopeptide (TPR) repeat protein